MAMVNVFADDVGITHPLVRRASPTVCELDEGDALFLPRGWRGMDSISVYPCLRHGPYGNPPL